MASARLRLVKPLSERPCSTEPITLRVYGVAGPQGSKTISRWGGVRESSAKVGPWRTEVAFTARETYKGDPITEPVALDITFFFMRPKGHYGTGRNADKLKPSAPEHCTSCTHGDLDKLCRSTFDGLAVRSGGSVIKDDSQVVRLRCDKRYADDDHPPGALVEVIPLR